MMQNEIQYMKRALKLGLKGIGFVNPNPLVGAVIVKDGSIIGEGYHERYGGLHAEINAISRCTQSPEGATMFVTLEPCCHFGKTPPCCDALIKARISKVVCAMPDPHEVVAGKGFQRLRDAGIEVVCGVLEKEALQINEIFVKYITTKQPFTVLKSAMTLDGKTASTTGNSKWISGEKSRAHVHKLRHRMSAVMVGINTVIADDPELTARVKGGRNPIRIVIDSKLRIPIGAKALNAKAQTFIITGLDADDVKARRLSDLGASIIRFPLFEGKIPLKSVMTELGNRGIDSVLIEGGGVLNSHALNEGIVDKIITFIAPKLIGGANAPTFFEGIGIADIENALKINFTNVSKTGEDIMLESYFIREAKCLPE